MKNTFDFNWNAKTVLVVEHEESVFNLSEYCLEMMGARAIQACSAEEIPEIFNLIRINVVLIDSKISNTEQGRNIVEEIKKCNPFIPVLDITNKLNFDDIQKQAI